MIICPLEGTVLFSGCPVTSCMWNNNRTGSCSAGSREFNSDSFNRELADCSEEEAAGVSRIKDFVTVGLFLEERLGDLSPLAKSSVNVNLPDEASFKQWLSDKRKKGSASHKLGSSYAYVSSEVIRGLKQGHE